MPDLFGLAGIASKFLLYLGILTSAGTVFAALLFNLSGLRPLIATFAALGIIASVLSFALGGAALTGEASGMLDPEMLGLLWSTPVGTVLAMRLSGLMLILVGLVAGRSGLWLSALGGGLAIGSFAATGHVSAQGTTGLTALLLFHLFAVSVWIGILTPLKRACQSARPLEAADLGHRFGRVAMVFVPLLVLAGLVMSYALVGSVTQLIGTGYGQALILKTALVVALLGLAALNKMRIVPALMAADVRAAKRLSGTITLEWGVVTAILGVSAVLTSTLTLPA